MTESRREYMREYMRNYRKDPDRKKNQYLSGRRRIKRKLGEDIPFLQVGRPRVSADDDK